MPLRLPPIFRRVESGPRLGRLRRCQANLTWRLSPVCFSGSRHKAGARSFGSASSECEVSRSKVRPLISICVSAVIIWFWGHYSRETSKIRPTACCTPGGGGSSDGSSVDQERPTSSGGVESRNAADRLADCLSEQAAVVSNVLWYSMNGSCALSGRIGKDPVRVQALVASGQRESAAKESGATMSAQTCERPVVDFPHGFGWSRSRWSC